MTKKASIKAREERRFDLFQVVSIALTIIYLFTSVIGYFMSKGIPTDLSPMPISMYVLKWALAIILVLYLTGITNHKRATKVWLAINTIAVTILAISPFTWGYYRGELELFFFELIALVILVGSNRGKFLRKMQIKRKPLHIVIILLIPIAICLAIYTVYGIH